MKYQSALAFALLFSILPTQAKLTPKVVYGQDDRLDVYETVNQTHLKLATATAAMIPSNSLQAQSDDSIEITGGTLEGDGMCATERFAKQRTAAMCSGFLVGDQYLVTAGHCIQTKADCKNNNWVFDYNVKSKDQADYVVSQSNVYGCSEIISQKLERSSQDDFALIKLDRPVVGIQPLKFRTAGKITDKARLIMIGHPSGLPTKIEAGGSVRNNKNSVYFQATTDSYGGNSGSAVFNFDTGEVEGILVRGDTDYKYDSRKGCYVTNVCREDSCRGEDVTRITNIAELKNIR
ncbi:MAG: serine protease [Bacteriovoracaceae bacterium]|nr:serine protease [Bacteriovoracaceae bacterium]